MVEFISSFVAGSAVTWFFAWLYYRRAGNELHTEAAELRRLTTLILTAFEEAGFVKVNWSPDGRAKGINIVRIIGPATLKFDAPAATVITTPTHGD